MMLQAILAAALALGAPAETASDVAAAVAKYARSPDEAAFLLAWGTHETRFAARLARNECKPWECDHGAAVGLFQIHRGAAGRDWAVLPGNIDAQVRSAARVARWAMHTCAKEPVLGGFRVLGGLGCDRPLKGENDRLRSFTRARGMLQ